MLEDYFHVGAFDRAARREQWPRFETRIEQNTLKALDLLDRFDIEATFFVLGWIADQRPDVVREIARRGHEIACRGYYPHSVRHMTPAQFGEDLLRSRDAVERAGGARVLGYRTAREWGTPSELWALDVLAKEGFAYDSSFAPRAGVCRREPWRRFPHVHRAPAGDIWEVPISTRSVLGLGHIPVAGGNYLRQLPPSLVRRAVERWDGEHEAPLVMYFHTWELDPDQPQIDGASLLTKTRQYRNLNKMSERLEEYFEKYRFAGVARHLGLDAEKMRHARADEPNHQIYLRGDARANVPAAPPAVKEEARPSARPADAEPRLPISVVVPCYNERPTLPYLSNTLRSVADDLGDQYHLQFIFVDDGSTDGTWDGLRQTFGSWDSCSFVRHERNRGVAAAIMTGTNYARTQIVCSIDCDCTYDPHELRHMIPRLGAGVDLVTASPYHPRGAVRNVPAWRLSLSKTASFIYRRLLRQKLFTYTSCFRVYRRDAVAGLRLREEGFLGVAEMLGMLDFGGAKIVEHPATLDVRLFGQSKMKVVRTSFRHLRLMTRFSLMRLQSGRRAAGDAARAETSPETAPTEFEHQMLPPLGEDRL